MTAKFNGKRVVKKGATKPSGKPAKQPTKVITTKASQAKASGGSAFAGSN